MSSPLLILDPTGSLDGWDCKPVSDITGRMEQLGDAILVLAWPPNPADAGPHAIQCRLAFVPAQWIVGAQAIENKQQK